MTWSKTTQTVVGIVVGAVAAAGLHVISTPVAADQRAPETPRVEVVMAAELAPETGVSVETAPRTTLVVDIKPAPRHEHVGQAVAVVETRRTSAPSDSATPSKAPKPPKSDPPSPDDPAPPPPDEPPPPEGHHHHHHHHPPPPPPG